MKKQTGYRLTGTPCTSGWQLHDPAAFLQKGEWCLCMFFCWGALLDLQAAASIEHNHCNNTVCATIMEHALMYAMVPLSGGPVFNHNDSQQYSAQPH
jgi:hypothetical protein